MASVALIAAEYYAIIASQTFRALSAKQRLYNKWDEHEVAGVRPSEVSTVASLLDPL